VEIGVGADGLAVIAALDDVVEQGRDREAWTAGHENASEKLRLILAKRAFRCQGKKSRHRPFGG